MAASAHALAGLGGEELGDGPLDLQVGLPGIEPLRHLFDIGAGRLELGDVREDQLVGVALLLHERRAELDPLLGVGDDLLEGRDPAPSPKAATISRV